MSVLCRIAHHNPAGVSNTMEITDLIKLAPLPDKHDCTHILRPGDIIWVTRLMQVDHSRNLEKPLIAAYICNMPDSFFETSQRMIRDSSEPLNIIAI